MKRIVVKFGTGVLTRSSGLALDNAQFRQLTSEIAQLIREGNSVIVVSSGAITAGVPILGLTARPTDLAGKQTCATIGQPRLMRMFDAYLRRYGLHAAQLLLSHGDIDSRSRRANAKNTLLCLLDSNTIVPIINENDAVAVEEINLGDNDRLSAEVAILANADLLVLATSSDGVLNNNERVPTITDFRQAFQYVLPEHGTFSVGGMKTKLEAARLATSHGIETVIVHGRKPGNLLRAAKGEDVGTRCSPRSIASCPES